MLILPQKCELVPIGVLELSDLFLYFSSKDLLVAASISLFSLIWLCCYNGRLNFVVYIAPYEHIQGTSS